MTATPERNKSKGTKRKRSLMVAETDLDLEPELVTEVVDKHENASLFYQNVQFITGWRVDLESGQYATYNKYNYKTHETTPVRLATGRKDVLSAYCASSAVNANWIADNVIPHVDGFILLHEVVVVAAPPKKQRKPVAELKNVGFLAYTTLQHNGNSAAAALYIDLVCAKEGRGYGRFLLCRAEELARERGIPTLALSSLTHLIPYYRRLGFRNTLESKCSTEHSADNGMMPIDDARVAERGLALDALNAHFGTESEALENQVASDFLQALADNEITHDRGDCTGTQVDLDHFPNSCAKNGYWMEYCVALDVGKSRICVPRTRQRFETGIRTAAISEFKAK